MTRLASGDRRLYLFAPAVHTGGGYVLLRDLLAVANLPPTTAFVDARVHDELCRLVSGRPIRVESVAPTVAGRSKAQVDLQRVARPGDTILCLQGVPPLLRTPARVVVFQQNRLMFGMDELSGYSWKARLQLRLGGWIAKRLRHRVAVWYVQTPSMRRALEAWHGGEPSVEVLPFAEVGAGGEHTAARSTRSASAGSGTDATSPIPGPPRWDFVYVSDGIAHKNHRRLLEAWCLLAAEGLYPKLALTLGERDEALVRWIDEQARAHGLQVTNLGHLEHSRVLALYREAGALVYPSLLESFGLPLIEASSRGLPIVAAERDFVRDVCAPVQTFDPLSPVSIARAVRRALGGCDGPIRVRSAAEFVEAVLQ